MRLSDLPPGKLRDQALAKLGQQPKAAKPRQSRPAGLPLVCSCGHRIEAPSESAIDRHGCTGRYTVDLEAT